VDRPRPLDDYLAAAYPFFVVPDADGGWVLTFPDLPGCVTKADRFEQIGERAEEARTLWLKTVYLENIEIPLPPSVEEYSGRFNLRLPRSLHQWLVESAAAEGVSLNQYVATLLARGDSQTRLERQLAEIVRPGAGGEETAMATIEVNKGIVRRYYQEIWNEGRLEVADEILPPGDEREEFKRSVARARAQAQHRYLLEDLIAEGDRVAAVVTARTSHSRLALPLIGQVGAGVQVSQPEVVIFRVQGGKIVGHSRHLGPAQELSAAAGRFDRFTERARTTFLLAEEEARRMRHAYIGTEHLLLGLLRGENTIAVKVLANLGIELEKVRSAVLAIIAAGDAEVAGMIGLTPRAKKVVELGAQEAERLNHHYIGTEHLLLGMVKEGHGIAANVLKSLGIDDLDRIRAEVLRVIEASRPKN
jgi:predicted RNase H-like HicB family nuclease/predicted ester cyclase